jgi:predicted ATPase/class 3 adenylate cyclase
LFCAPFQARDGRRGYLIDYVVGCSRGEVWVAELPSGTVTFLFTDLEDSTALWERHPDAMRAALARHDEIVPAAVEDRGGYVVKSTGDGFLAAFASAADAVGAAIDAQLALVAEMWTATGPLRVRMGIHTGAAELRDGDYHGPPLNRAARLMSVGHGGQILVSLVTSELVRGSGVELVDLGSHELRGMADPEHVFQVVHPGLESEFGALRTPATTRRSPPSNLPAPLDRFVGRVRERAAIEDRLGRSRLLTLFGPGGTGKTRLAVQLASDLRDDFDDRVYLVDLSACRDVESVLSVTARTIGVHEQSNRSLLDAIEEQVGSQRMLLVLDNFEQVTVAAIVVAELLRECPELKLLVTSREALNVTGEQVYPVPPLALPEAGIVVTSVTELFEYEAVQLFVERARAVDVDFQLTAENALAVIEICVRLDGLPLAIELATARLALFSSQTLVERLGDRLDLLTGGARDAPERQRALRDTINWSYELLTPDEQRLLALLAVFSSATVEAVETIAGRVQGSEGIDVLDELNSLVHKSLLRQRDVDASGPRLVMLETIRAFAAEQLDGDPDLRAAAQRAHAQYFADWTLHHCEKLTGDERDAVSQRMAADSGNLAAAWQYWVSERDFEELGKLTDGLWLLYNARGWHHETAKLITDLLDVLSTAPSSQERLVQQILLQTSLARVLMATEGYTPATERAYERALELCEAQGEFPELLPVLRGLSTFFIYRAEFEKSLRIGEQLLGLAERFDDARARVEGHLVIGASEGLRAHLQAAIDHLEEGITEYRAAARKVERFETGNDPGVVCLVVEGMLLWMNGHPDRARVRGDEAVLLAERLRHPQSAAYAHFHTGLIHMWLRDAERAAEHAQEVIDIAAAHEFPVWTAAASCLHGAALAATGAVDAGMARFEAAMTQYRALKTPPVFWPALLQLYGAVLGLAGRFDDGVARVDEALDVVAALPEPQSALFSELLLLKGNLLLAYSNDATEAETWFVRAVQNADGLEAPTLQLRATTALARLWATHGKVEPATDLLTVAYERLTEGFTTPDLTDARQLLDELAAAR